MEQQGRRRLTGIAKVLATQRDQLDESDLQSLDAHGIKHGLFNYPRLLSDEHPKPTIYMITAEQPAETVNINMMQEITSEPMGASVKCPRDACTYAVDGRWLSSKDIQSNTTEYSETLLTK